MNYPDDNAGWRDVKLRLAVAIAIAAMVGIVVSGIAMFPRDLQPSERSYNGR